jgi:hypothetical protein
LVRCRHRNEQLERRKALTEKLYFLGIKPEKTESPV